MTVPSPAEPVFHLAAPKIIAETPQWLAVGKPSGWLTIPGRSSPKSPSTPPAPILFEWAKKYSPSLFVTHRLDRETSGIVLFARTPQDHQQANLWFQTRKVKKTYHCLAQGTPSSPILKLTFPIEGASSTTLVEVKERYPEGFLAQVTPRTGRRHQIRIHLSNNQTPIWGDPLYGGPTEITLGTRTLSIPRVALHALKLELPSGEVFQAEYPPDFIFWLTLLRKESQRVG